MVSSTPPTSLSVLGYGHPTMTITHLVEQMQSDRQAGDSRSYLVQRAEKLALAYVDKPLQVSALSRALGVSERTLRKLFNEIHGRPPSRHLRMLRLSQVRGALLSSRGQLVTVTEIATDFGFGELGRFSVEYRKVFGESPSETLHPTRLSSSMNAPDAGGNAAYPILHR
jgi:transcriptional regulator GlxA family with amidase domain